MDTHAIAGWILSMLAAFAARTALPAASPAGGKPRAANRRYPMDLEL